MDTIEVLIVGAGPAGLRAAQVLAEGIEGLVEATPAPLLIGLGPQHEEEAIPADAAVAGARQQGQDGQPARLLRGTADGAIAIEDGKTAQGAYPEHDPTYSPVMLYAGDSGVIRGWPGFPSLPPSAGPNEPGISSP